MNNHVVNYITIIIACCVTHLYVCNSIQHWASVITVPELLVKQVKPHPPVLRLLEKEAAHKAGFSKRLCEHEESLIVKGRNQAQ